MIWAVNPGIAVPPETAILHVDAAIGRLKWIHEELRSIGKH
jgi:hypothetical protein